MRKWITLVMAIAAVALLVIGFMGQKPLSREDAISRIQEKYPEADPDPVHIDQCGASGNPCWRSTFRDEEGSIVTMEIDTSTGESSEHVDPCTDWWCDAPPCDYVLFQQMEGYSVTYYNSGCSSPLQSCNATYNACGVCQTKQDCVRKTVTDYGNETTYLFEVLETPAYGTINTTGNECFIYDKNLDMIFWNTTSPQDCETIMTYYTKCAYDACDFIPTYTLIPI